jgi:hypothetical protein
MRLDHLLLPCYNDRRERTHDGVSRSGAIWAGVPAVFTIRCWNGEVVQELFSLDRYDREAKRWLATNGDISEMVRDLMSETIEYRFGPAALSVPHPIEWL